MNETIWVLLLFVIFYFEVEASTPCDGECHSEDTILIFITKLALTVLSTLDPDYNE